MAEVKSIEERRNYLVLEKMELSKQLAELGISGNRKYYARGSIDKGTWELRTQWAKRVAEIEKELIVVNKEIKETHTKKTAIRAQLWKEVISESLGASFSTEASKEVERRENGEYPMKVSFEPPKKEIKTYKKDYSDLIDKIMEARRTINKWIADNEPDINKADYVIRMKPLSQSLPTIQELQKLKP